jgi:hypothetical protein
MTPLDALIASIEPTPGGEVSLRLSDGRDWQDVAFVQLFPHSRPTEYISVRQKQGAEYEEIGIIRDVSALAENVRRVISDDIRRRYFLPLITDIVSLKTSSGTDTWVVETDRGAKTFTVRERSENVLTADQVVVLITDTDKCRYKITDISALPSRARLFLEKVLM